MAVVETVDADAVLVTVEGRGTGWVMRQVLDLTPGDRAIVLKKRAQEKAAADKKRAEEKAYVATLPKLRNGGGPIFVATSFDCARDFRKVIEFGRKNGTGVEYRKKMVELVTLGCTTKIDAGTAINVISQKDGFVQFRAYNGD
jgi:hypothetical protein